MKRRNFLRTTAVAAATLPLSAAPYLNLEGQPPVGHGDFKYKVDKRWGALDPAKLPVQNCHEMVLDSQQRLICSTVSPKADVLVYNKDGKLLDSWDLGLTVAHGLTKVGEGKDETFLITDSKKGRVLHLSADGRMIRELTVAAEHIPEDKAFKPTETTVAANGDVYVADGYGTNQIFHFDAKGRLKNVFGGPDHFDCCHGILVDDRRGTPELLITSRAAQEFQRWTLDGKHISTRKLPGLQICRPVMQGEYTLFAVIVTKSWKAYDGMIAVLDKEFNVVSLPGGSAPINQQDFKDVVYDGQTFLNPHDVCPDEDGNLYVPQWNSDKTYPIRLKRV